MKNVIFIAAILIGSSFLFSCKKEGLNTSPDAGLNISTDSVKFDTVFTSIGSITKSFKISNPNDQRLRIGIKLMGGLSSPFKININGVAATSLNSIDVAAEDSIYVFVSVFVNPNANNLPFVLSDSIAIDYNGQSRLVQLEAYGQNARFLRNELIDVNTVWNQQLPYVLMGPVQIAENTTLTIEKGTKIFATSSAAIIVDGSLQINGTVDEKVIFSGNRLDLPYKNYPASWPGIYFRENSKNNVIKFAEIKNAYQAVVALLPSPNANAKVNIHQSIIENAYDAGILSYNSSVAVENSLIANCGTNIAIELGGKYSFTNCTIASYSNQFIQHRLPVLKVWNFSNEQTTSMTQDIEAVFTNCILWGDNNSLVSELDIQKKGNNSFSVVFENCLYKAESSVANASFLNSLSNQEPKFDSIDIKNNLYDFGLNLYGGATLDAGKLTSFSKDLDNNNRLVGTTDIGCYEKQ